MMVPYPYDQAHNDSNDNKFLDRQVPVNSVDPDIIAIKTVSLGSSLKAKSFQKNTHNGLQIFMCPKLS